MLHINAPRAEPHDPRRFGSRSKPGTPLSGHSPTATANSQSGFNATEASRLLNERWAETMRALSDDSTASGDRPHVHKAVQTDWGVKSSLHLQASVGDFLAELRTALTRTGNPPKQTHGTKP